MIQVHGSAGGQDVPVLTGNTGMSLIVPGFAYIYIFCMILKII